MIRRMKSRTKSNDGISAKAFSSRRCRVTKGGARKKSSGGCGVSTHSPLNKAKGGLTRLAVFQDSCVVRWSHLLLGYINACLGDDPQGYRS